MTHVTRAAIYTRVSTIAQATDGTSLETQRAHCQRHAAERGYQVVAIFRDVHSGRELAGRPELTALRQLVRAGGVEVVVAYAVDRLAREVAHFHFLLVEAAVAGCAVELATEELGVTPTGKLLRAVRAFVAEHEVRQLSERCARGKRARAEAGRLPTNNLPFGYRWADGTRVTAVAAEGTAPIVVAIFRAAAAGERFTAIANRLNAAGIPSPRDGAKGWSVSTLRRLVANPAYKGEATALRTATLRRPDGRPALTSRPAAQWIRLTPSPIPALVTAEEWRAVAANVAARHKHRGVERRAPGHFLLAGGCGRCGCCGRALIAQGERDGARFYRCAEGRSGSGACARLRVEAESLDRRVWTRVIRTAMIGGPPAWTASKARRYVRFNDADIGAELARLGRRRAAAAGEVGSRCSQVAPGARDTSDDDGVRLLVLRARATEIRAGWMELATLSGVEPGLDGWSWEARRSWLNRLGIVVRIWPRSAGRLYEVVSMVDLDAAAHPQPPVDVQPVPPCRRRQRCLRSGELDASGP